MEYFIKITKKIIFGGLALCASFCTGLQGQEMYKHRTYPQAAYSRERRKTCEHDIVSFYKVLCVVSQRIMEEITEGFSEELSFELRRKHVFRGMQEQCLFLWSGCVKLDSRVP